MIFLFSRSLIAVLRSAGDYKKSNHAEEEHYIISKALQVSNQQYVDAKRRTTLALHCITATYLIVSDIVSCRKNQIISLCQIKTVSQEPFITFQTVKYCELLPQDQTMFKDILTQMFFQCPPDPIPDDVLRNALEDQCNKNNLVRVSEKNMYRRQSIVWKNFFLKRLNSS